MSKTRTLAAALLVGALGFGLGAVRTSVQVIPGHNHWRNTVHRDCSACGVEVLGVVQRGLQRSVAPVRSGR